MTTADDWERHAAWWQAEFTEGADPEYDEQLIPLAVELVEPLGSDTLIFFRAGDKEIVARVPPKLGLAAGDTVKLKADMQAVHFFDPQSELRLAAEG